MLALLPKSPSRQSRTFAVFATCSQLVTRRTQTAEAARRVPALVLAGPPELTLVHICVQNNIKERSCTFFSLARAGERVRLARGPTDARAVSAGVADRAALSGDARRSLRAGQDGPSQRGHQLRAEPRPDSGAVAEGPSSLQARTGASVSEQHRTGGTQASEAAGDVTALVGAGVRGLLTFIDVWGDRGTLPHATAAQRWTT